MVGNFISTNNNTQNVINKLCELKILDKETTKKILSIYFLQRYRINLI